MVQKHLCKRLRSKFFVSVPKLVGNLSMFQKIWGCRKILCIRGGGGEYYESPSEIFCLILPKNFVWDPSVGKNFGYRKIFCMRGVARFSVDYFMSHSTETFVGEPFSVLLI